MAGSYGQSAGVPSWATRSLVIQASLVILASLATVSCTGPNIVDSLLFFAMDGFKHASQEPGDQPEILAEYDFVIVGAGTAGCVLANRLTENPKWKVLLIEAGDAENFLMDVPILAHALQLTNANWRYKSAPDGRSCLGMENSQCNIPRGKVMGGSSVLNYMVMSRGHREDYNSWEAAGNVGWGYRQVLKYFKKSEDMRIDELKYDKYHSRRGYMTVTRAPAHTPVSEAFVRGGQELGYKEIDYNGENQIGFSFHQVNMRNGTRLSSSKAYLHPIRGRINFHVKKSSHVTKILIKAHTKQAYGVEFVQRGVKRTVKARREVIISAGAINSPQLLMLSGVGPKDHLERFQIPVIKDLPVGYNLQDHVAIGGLTFTVDQPVSLRSERIVGNVEVMSTYGRYHTGYASIPGGTEALAFFNTADLLNHTAWPDLELQFIGGTITSEPSLKTVFGIRHDIFHRTFRSVHGRDGYMIFPMVLRPKSRGRVTLQSADPFQSPIIDMGYFTDPADLDVAVKGVEMAMRLSETPAMKRLNSRINPDKVPACEQYDVLSTDYWKCHASYLTFTVYHQSGTCKMGPDSDPTAVLDDRLRVKGVKRLRVIDASIMPTIPAAHTNYPTIMIAEKGSDMIKEDHS